jgi:aspartyl-tRNA(Asn)/glutamyl-tRNA(Gln) amidotransferase subunit A
VTLQLSTLDRLAGDLAAGRTTSRALVEKSLTRIADPAGEGARTFLKVDTEGALAAADYQDGLRKRGFAPSRFAGIPFSVKDIFDLAGQVTTAGSKVLTRSAPATADATAIAALKSSGFVVLGRTNMTEFAYSGVGLNPHYGTPKSVYDREVGRIPGGSSSGAAVAVADGMCALSIGTDTGGSCRIPAAYNGIFGFKPSASRVSKSGVFPLSSSLDSIGPLAGSVACCATADAIMSGDWNGIIIRGPARPLRIGVLKTLVMDGLDGAVAEDFARVLARLKARGVIVEDVSFDLLLDLPVLLKRGGIVGAEVYAAQRELLAAGEHEYDHRVSSRIALAAGISAADYINLTHRRAELILAFASLAQGFDALVMPTVAIVPPRIMDLSKDEDYMRLNGVSLRNTYVGNFLNGCSMSVPMHESGKAPTGFMLLAPWGHDQALFSAADFVAGCL